MADPTISGANMLPIRQIQPPATSAPVGKPDALPSKDFKEYLLSSLEKVNQLQNEAVVVAKWQPSFSRATTTASKKPFGVG